MGEKFNFNGRFVKEKQFRYSYGCRAIFSLLRRARTLALPIVVQLVSHLGVRFCEKSTKIGTLSQFKHCRVTLKILPEQQFRLNETSNHFIQGEGGGRGRGRPLAVGMIQHTA